MITASVISHGHGEMVSRLVEQVLLSPEVSRVIVTLNINELLVFPKDARVVVICNESPKGFGTNHNAAFMHCDTPFFCVLNPDIELTGNPFPKLCAHLTTNQAGLCAPIILRSDGAVEDSVREFITPCRMLLRKLGFGRGDEMLKVGTSPSYPDWVAGMFMLFDADAYRSIKGFDTAYFMYCEDTDICTRLWQAGKFVVVCPDVQVIHHAQRASRKDLRHFSWHMASMLRYIARYWGRLPRKLRQL